MYEGNWGGGGVLARSSVSIIISCELMYMNCRNSIKCVNDPCNVISSLCHNGKEA